MKRLSAFLLVLTLLLSGCSTFQEEPDEPEYWDIYQPGSAGFPEETPPPEEEPEHPAAFTLSYYKNSTLDPITCGEIIQQDIASLLYEPLFRLNAQFEPEPVLCESWAWDEKGLVCTLELRQDAAFQDGSPLTAKDVAAGLQRAKASERYGYRLRKIAAVAASRTGQVVITLTEPNQGLFALLDIPIVKSGTENQQAPVGTGPYRFVSGGTDDYLEANPDWWQRKSLPVSTIPLVNTKDRDTARYLFSSRRIELLTMDPMDNLASVTGQSESTDRPTSILQYIGFNTASPVFSDPAARSAFSRGIPRGTMANAQLAGLAAPAQFPVSPRSPLYPADLEVSYSRDDAMTALTEAGQATGEVKELTLLINEEDPFRLTSAQFIAENLTLLDWKITVQALPWEEYLPALSAGSFDLYFGEVKLTADWDLSDLIGTGGALNYGRYADPSADALLQNFAAASDRTAAARQLFSYLQATVPIVPVCFKTYSVLSYPGTVEGMTPSPSSTFFGLENWTVHLDTSQ